MKKLLTSTLLLSVCAAVSFAQNVADTASLVFRQGRWQLEDTRRDSRERVDEMVRNIRAYAQSDSALFRVKGISVVGGASPEGSVAINERLSRQRAATIFGYFSENLTLPDSSASFTYLGRDWNGLKAMVEQDEEIPYRAETLALLNEITAATARGERADDHNLARLKALRGGVPYAYMYGQLFPALRESRLVVDYSLRRPMVEFSAGIPEISTTTALCVPAIFAVAAPAPQRPFYMALKTNMLYDALALPSIGAEFYVGKNLSVGANWTYGWWDNDHRHRYWRAYGGDATLRWWFGRRAQIKPLTGHHLGVYAGVLTFDFEWGGTGYMGGVPGGTLWDRCMVNAGVEYGYSLPVGRRINIDFTIGIGVLSGKYVKYEPAEVGYLWKSTRHVNWVGPTKAEISLVWLIGRGNYNSGKGGHL